MRRTRSNPSPLLSFGLTVAAGVVSSLIGMVVIEALRRRQLAAAPERIEPPAPGHGTA